jgi:hypothetical protein
MAPHFRTGISQAGTRSRTGWGRLPAGILAAAGPPSRLEPATGTTGAARSATGFIGPAR